MQTIKVNFGYFWADFKNDDNYFTRALSKKYKVELSEDPDLFFFTHPYNGKHDYLKYKCHRIFLGWENERANWNICDYVLDSDFYNGNPRHKRWPLWAAWEPARLTGPKDMQAFAAKDKFCCMVVSNGKAKERIDFFNRLSAYKQVDSGGRYMNNVGGPVKDKMDFISRYKFVISFENSASPGYTTEKLVEPMLVNSVPVYWGNPAIGQDFNTESFINITGPKDYDTAIQKILSLDSDNEQYMALAARPWFNKNSVPPDCTEESFEAFLDYVIKDSDTKIPVGRSVLKATAHKAGLLSARLVNAALHRLGIEKGFR